MTDAVREVELLCEDFDTSMPFVAGKVRAAIAELEAKLDTLGHGYDALRNLLEAVELEEITQLEERAEKAEAEARKWELVAEQCIQRGLMGGWQITDRDTFLDGLLARYQPAAEEEK